MKELKYLALVLLAAVFFIGLFVLCDKFSDEVISEYSSSIAPSLIDSSSTQTSSATIDDVCTEDKVFDMIESDYTINLKLLAAGEIMCQNQQLAMAYDEENQTFSFEEGLKYLKDLLQNSDLTFSALGTTIAGSGNGYSSSYYGYSAEGNMYNSPEALLSDLQNAGITMLDTATRHALDSGIEGLDSTIDNIDSLKITHIGTAKTESETKDYILKVNYATIAFAAYTQDTNGQTIPEGSEYAINSLGDYDDSKVTEMCSHIQQLQSENDYVIVMVDFGSSDSDEIETDQKQLAQKMAEAGANLIIGYGTRAVKPMEVIMTTDDSGIQHKCTVFYGLGCVYSSDYYSEYEDLDTDIGLILKLNLKSSVSGLVDLTEFDVIPVYLNWQDDLVQPLPVCKAKDTSDFSSLLDEDDQTRIDSAYTDTIKHLLSGTKYTSTYNKKTYSYTVSLY